MLDVVYAGWGERWHLGTLVFAPAQLAAEDLDLVRLADIGRHLAEDRRRIGKS
jgi:hypothetical protein